MANNLIVTKLTYPVYTTMDWSTPMGIIVPIGFLLFSPVIFFLYEFLNNCKLKMAGHHKIIEISTGRELRKKRRLE